MSLKPEDGSGPELLRRRIAWVRSTGGSINKAQRRELLQTVVNAAVTTATMLSGSSDADAAALGKEVVDWLRSEGDLRAALGFRQRGGISPDRADQIAERDALLVQAKRDHRIWSSLPANAAARAMRLNFDRYETGRWPRERHAIGAPAFEPSATWWRILRGTAPMPGVERLGQILMAAAT